MPLITLLRAFHIAATCVIGGTIAFDLLVLGRGPNALTGAAAEQVRRWLGRLLAAAIVVALLSWCGWLAEVAIGMSGLPAAQALAVPVLRTVVTRTSFGQVWAIRLLLLLLLAAGLPALSPQRRFGVRDAAMAVAGAGLVATLAACGHALASARAHLWVDAGHLIGAALWLGMLPPLLAALPRVTAGAAPGCLELAATALRRFSPPAMLAVAVLAVTGVANACWLVGSVSDLVTSGYGRLLLAKLALFAVMLLLALANRLRLMPWLDRAAASGDRLAAIRRLRRNVVAELLLGAAVLAFVGVLGVTAPPAHERAMEVMPGMDAMQPH
jgi:putative copper resistance protein D